MIKQDVISVSEFVNQIKNEIDSNPSFKNVALIGELSNFKAHRSGHFYFSLKDERSRINCAMFKSSATRVLFQPKDGDKVIVFGRLAVYTETGSIQIYAERMNLDGLGDLHIQFEKLKKSYEDKGYFQADVKKTIPKFPNRIGVIVGPNSAAYADISRTLAERWPLAKQIDLLSFVQGENAIPDVVSKINEANRQRCDTIILGRGGGSIEDLWAFNSPEVIEAIFQSDVPIITGIGHESDVTLADFVSDYRAATPTAAAVAATPNAADLKKNLRDFKNKYYISVRNKLRKNQKDIEHTVGSSPLKNPIQFIDLKQHHLNSVQGRVTHKISRFDVVRNELVVMDTINVNNIKKTFWNKGNLIALTNSKSQNAVNLHITNCLYNVSTNNRRISRISQTFTKKIVSQSDMISQNNRRFEVCIYRSLNLKKTALNDILKLLSYRNPSEILIKNFNKGFSLTKVNGDLVSSIKDVNVHDNISIEVSDGYIQAQVLESEKKEDDRNI